MIDSEAILKWNEEAEKYKYTFRTGENDFFKDWVLEDYKYTMSNFFYKDSQANSLRLC